MGLQYSLGALVRQHIIPSKAPTQHSLRSQLPDQAGLFMQLAPSNVAEGDHPNSSRINEPLWNFSSIGGTILRTLLNSIFDDVDTWWTDSILEVCDIKCENE